MICEMPTCQVMLQGTKPTHITLTEDALCIAGLPGSRQVIVMLRISIHLLIFLFSFEPVQYRKLPISISHVRFGEESDSMIAWTPAKLLYAADLIKPYPIESILINHSDFDRVIQLPGAWHRKSNYQWSRWSMLLLSGGWECHQAGEW